MRAPRLVGLPATVCLVVAACGGDDPAETAATAALPAASTPTEAADDPTDAGGGPATPEGGGIGTTGSCDRLTPAELSNALGATFSPGTQIANEPGNDQCLFDSDGPPQALIGVYQDSSQMVCELLGSESETVEVAGSPGWWDELGAQARVCLADGDLAITLSGGGGDNSVHRDALLDLLATAAGR